MSLKFHVGKNFLLLQVEEIHKADLKNNIIQETIKNRIFEEWSGNFLKEGIKIDI